MPNPKLTIELVPASSWGDNLRSLLSAAQWKALRTACYHNADHKCEVCGGVGRNHPVEAHEIWEYQDGPQWIQKLTGLIALCPSCHKCKHMGFASIQGPEVFARAINHLAKVNEWSTEQAYEYICNQFEIHNIRSRMKWTVDTSWLDNADKYISDSSNRTRQASVDRAVSTLEAITRSREERAKRLLL